MNGLLHLIILLASVYGLVLFGQRRTSDTVIFAFSLVGLWVTLGSSAAIIIGIVVYLLHRRQA